MDKEEAKQLFRRFRTNRSGVRKNPALASLCLICGSTDVVPLAGHEPPTMHCRSCGFNFVRYACWKCGETIDGRDPLNPPCGECGWRTCVCTACQPEGCGEQAGHAKAATEP
ncbi:MAG: hypothetical protein ED859_03445 [Desulfuromonadales bacterium]|nr:MAG: hypothetical protein ED859_03445 [Desulfuromonadales bacterium]